MIELLPWAMLAKGPQCTKAGLPASVCIKLGMMASLSRTVIAPATFKSSAVMGVGIFLPPIKLLRRLVPMMMRPIRSRRSARSLHMASAAMISEATVMSKPASRGTPSLTVPRPVMMLRSAASLTSTTRRHWIE
jgi:hypothetical protein